MELVNWDEGKAFFSTTGSGSNEHPHELQWREENDFINFVINGILLKQSTKSANQKGRGW